MIRITLLFGLLLLALAACGFVPAAWPAAVSPAVATITSLPGAAGLAPSEAALTTPALLTPPASSPSTAEPALAVRPQYFLNVLFDEAERSILVGEQLTYTHPGPHPLDSLLLMVEANRIPGVFSLDGLAWADGQPISAYQLTGVALTIPLAPPLPAGQTIGLKLLYRLVLPALEMPLEFQRAIAFGYTARQSNFVDWYPYVPPLDKNNQWLVHPPANIGEYQAYTAADFRVTINTIPGSDALPVIAASAAAAGGQQDGSWQYHLVAGRSFAWSASPLYQVLTTTVGTVAVSSYFFPDDAAAAKAALQAAASALETYQALFGAYPHPALSVVEADFLDGMEYSGLFFLSYSFYESYDGSALNYLTAIAVHETAHQWWYERTASDQALEPWLDEALCTYSESLFYETVHPSLLDWWWRFRVEPYPAEGSLSRSIYDFPTFRAYRDVIYLRGALFLRDLRAEMGDQAFFQFLRAYASQTEGNIATQADFFAILKEFDAQAAQRLLSLYFSP